MWEALTAERGHDREPVTEVIQRGVKMRLLKYMAASGAASMRGGAQSSRRKSSSAAGSEGQWAFWYARPLRVYTALCGRGRAPACARTRSRGFRGGGERQARGQGEDARARQRTRARARRLGRHLRIQDQVLQVLLSAEARALHAVCAQSLGGLVLTSQLAIHFEQAGLAWDAAKTHARALVVVIAAACRARLR